MKSTVKLNKTRERDQEVRDAMSGSVFLKDSARVMLSRDLSEMRHQPHTLLGEEQPRQRTSAKSKARSPSMLVVLDEQQRHHHGYTE